MTPEGLRLTRPAVAVIGTNVVFDYGTPEAARAAFDALAPAEPGLDVERLADAMHRLRMDCLDLSPTNVCTGSDEHRIDAEAVVREYARLSAPQEETTQWLLLNSALDHDDYVLIHRNDWSRFRAALSGPKP